MSLADALAARKAAGMKPVVTKIRTATGALFEERKDPVTGALVKVAAGQEVLPTFQQNAAKGFAQLFPYAFDKAKGKWQKLLTPQAPPPAAAAPAKPAAAGAAAAAGAGAAKADAKADAKSADAKVTAAPAELKFVSYNVWFSEAHWQARATALLGLVQHYAPDIVCLQEVTPQFMGACCAHEYVRANYYASDGPDALTVNPYGVVMLTRRTAAPVATVAGAAAAAAGAGAAAPAVAWPVPEVTIHALPSNMGRRFVRAVLRFGGAEGGAANAWAVGTAHLESLDNAEYRAAQLSAILPLLSEEAVAQHGVWMGDSNFTDAADVELQVLKDFKPPFVDVHCALKPGDTTETGPAMGRIDKVLLRSSAYAPAQLQLIGTEPLALPGVGPGRTVRPSDHFGLFGSVKRK